MSSIDFTLYIGSTLFIAWVALFTGLVGLWAWSKLGAPVWTRINHRRTVTQQRGRPSQFFSVVEKNAAQARLVALTGSRRDAEQANPRNSIGSVLPTSMLRVVAASSSVAMHMMEHADSSRRPGLAGRWKAHNRVPSPTVLRQITQ